MVAGICNVEYITFDYIFHKLIIQLHPALWFNEKWEKHKKYMEKGKKRQSTLLVKEFPMVF